MSFKSLDTHKFESNLGKFDINTVLQIFKSDIKKIYQIKLVNIIGVDTAFHILKNLHEYNKSYYVPEMLQKSVSWNVLEIKIKNFLLFNKFFFQIFK